MQLIKCSFLVSAEVYKYSFKVTNIDCLYTQYIVVSLENNVAVYSEIPTSWEPCTQKVWEEGMDSLSK